MNESMSYCLQKSHFDLPGQQKKYGKLRIFTWYCQINDGKGMQRNW